MFETVELPFWLLLLVTRVRKIVARPLESAAMKSLKAVLLNVTVPPMSPVLTEI